MEMEPAVGIEPTTLGLRYRCSTTELSRPKKGESTILKWACQERPPAGNRPNLLRLSQPKPCFKNARIQMQKSPLQKDDARPHPRSRAELECLRQVRGVIEKRAKPGNLTNMSTAFLKEETLEQQAVIPIPVSLLPRGAKNYVTLQGMNWMRAELKRLVEQEGPSLAALPQEEADTKRLRQILSRRIEYLQESLRTAETPARPAGEDRVEFGSTVTVRDPQKVESTYQLVGVDEADADMNRISWLAPIAKALWHARVGERVPFKRPSGRTELEVVAIAYEATG
jgi:transcription elongation factor GreB